MTAPSGILNAIKYLLFTLWRKGMSREEREEAAGAIRKPLFTLVNSTKRHLEDGDEVRLQARIDSTLRELHGVAQTLRERGYPGAAAFIDKHAGFMVTFAELALEGVRIPYTTNRIERLMGEISKRCKHKWMHWSSGGLKNVLTLVLVRYTDGDLYENFKTLICVMRHSPDVHSRILSYNRTAPKTCIPPPAGI